MDNEQIANMQHLQFIVYIVQYPVLNTDNHTQPR